MTEETRRHFEALAKRYGFAPGWVDRDLCPDEISSVELESLLAIQRKSALIACEWCGCPLNQHPDWLGKAKMCTVCAKIICMTGGPPL